MVLQERLVLALQVLFEHDAAHLRDAVMLVPDARLGEPVGGEEVRVVLQLAGLADTGVERLAVLVTAGAAVGFQQVQASVRERHALLVVAQRERLDQALLPQVRQGLVPIGRIVAGLHQIALGHDAERAHGGQRAALLAVQLVGAVAVQHDFPLAAERQVEVVQQGVARVGAALSAIVRAVTIIAVAVAGRVSGIEHGLLLSNNPLGCGMARRCPRRALRQPWA